MERIFYSSGNSLYMIEDGKTTELPSRRLEKYSQVLREIRQRREWKTSGTGAKFTGNYESYDDDNDIYATDAEISGIAAFGDGFIYSVNIDGVGGIYIKSTDPSDKDEGHVISSNNMSIHTLSVRDDMCAACTGGVGMERHISLFALPSGKHTELTEGDTREEYPFYSLCSDKIYFTASGFARRQNGSIAASSPRSIAFYSPSSGLMESVVEDDEIDYILPKDDEQGNLYYIKRPYSLKPPAKSILIDIILFPYRLVKAIIGFLNVFSMFFGGEPLNSGGKRNASKAKQKSEKELFINGNLVNAEQTLKENSKLGEKSPGIIPRNWELTRRGVDGKETCIRGGVMDYIVCKNGDIIYSNGKGIIKIKSDGSEEFIAKAKLASNLVCG